MRTMIGGFVMTLAVLVALPLAQGGRKVHGVVVAAATGRPVANARVKYEEQGRAGQTAVTDANGRRSEVVTVTVGPGMMQQNVVLRLP